MNMNAFDQAKPRRKVHKTVKSIDVELITIKNDPFPGQRACPEGKYAELFAKMKPGQCLSCEPDEVQPLGAAMRKWIASQDKAAKQKKAPSKSAKVVAAKTAGYSFTPFHVPDDAPICNATFMSSEPYRCPELSYRQPSRI